MGNTYNTKKDLIRDLAQYNLCHKEAITREEAEEYMGNEDFYVDFTGNYYLCTLDKPTNTRILLRIFKCINFIKNVVLAGLIGGGVGIGILIFKMLSN